MSVAHENSVPTSDASVAQDKPGHWFWRVVVLSLSLLGLVIGLPGARFMYIWHRGKVEVARALEETDKLYPNWRWDDLVAQREPLDPSEDAWPIVVELARRFRTHPRASEFSRSRPGSFWDWYHEEALKHPNRSLPPHLLESINHWQADDPTLVQCAFQLLQYRRARIPLSPMQPDPYMVSLGMYDIPRGTMNALQLLHEGFCSEKRFREAEAMLLAQWVVGTCCDDELYALGQIAGLGLEGRAVRRIERHLALGKLSQETRTRLAQILEQRANRNPFLIMVRAERAAIQVAYDSLSSGRLTWRQFAQPIVHSVSSPIRPAGWSETWKKWVLEDLPHATKQRFAYPYYLKFHAANLRYLNQVEAFARLPFSDQAFPENQKTLKLPPEALEPFWAAVLCRGGPMQL
ncbi:MAG: hypothetical protein NZM42_13015, partial [Gemmatales bacterium]|nr:hypothetical protein [Gemmatales bacterium]